MYPDWFNQILRCPEDGAVLIPAINAYNSYRRSYPVINGILSAVYPSALGGLDGKYNKMYNLLAPFYDLNERLWGRLLFGLDMKTGRREIIAHLGLKPGMRILEVSPGPGVFQEYIRQEIGEQGEFAALDLSMNMLKQCRKRNQHLQVQLIHGNALYLPFADNSFDALFHFGGINLFNDPQKAVQEFIRVVKKDGIVSWGDEGISPQYTNVRRKKIAEKINPGFLKPRPEIPSSLKEGKMMDVYGGLAYLVVGKKA